MRRLLYTLIFTVGFVAVGMSQNTVQVEFQRTDSLTFYGVNDTYIGSLFIKVNTNSIIVKIMDDEAIQLTSYFKLDSSLDSCNESCTCYRISDIRSIPTKGRLIHCENSIVIKYDDGDWIRYTEIVED